MYSLTLQHRTQCLTSVSKYELYSTLDLQSIYSQISIKKEVKPYTAFEACGNLYQFCRVTFRVTNGVACFQRVVDDINDTEKLIDAFAYVDHVIVCSKDKDKHDEYIKWFPKTAKKYGIKFKYDKSTFSETVIQLLRFEISKGKIKPNPERLKLPIEKEAYAIVRTLKKWRYYLLWNHASRLCSMVNI